MSGAAERKKRLEAIQERLALARQCNKQEMIVEREKKVPVKHKTHKDKPLMHCSIGDSSRNGYKPKTKSTDNSDIYFNSYHKRLKSCSNSSHSNDVDGMVDELNNTIESRKTKRRKTHYADLDVSYINHHNMRFNSKLDKSFSKYTSQIKRNFELGTAT